MVVLVSIWSNASACPWFSSFSICVDVIDTKCETHAVNDGTKYRIVRTHKNKIQTINCRFFTSWFYKECHCKSFCSVFKEFFLIQLLIVFIVYNIHNRSCNKWRLSYIANALQSFSHSFFIDHLKKSKIFSSKTFSVERAHTHTTVQQATGSWIETAFFSDHFWHCRRQSKKMKITFLTY